MRTKTYKNGKAKDQDKDKNLEPRTRMRTEEDKDLEPRTKPRTRTFYNVMEPRPRTQEKPREQQCMFESPVKQNLSSPILATMFLLQSPEGAR